MCAIKPAAQIPQTESPEVDLPVKLRTLKDKTQDVSLVEEQLVLTSRSKSIYRLQCVYPRN
jgi:hypothetical protein